MVDLGEYYSGGYFLIRADKPDWPQLQTEIFPDKLLSLSCCICPQRFRVSWGWEPGDREAAAAFGIPETRFDEFSEWSQTTFQTETDLPSMFYSPEIARRFVERFLTNTADLFLLGVGLHQSEIAVWDELPEITFGGVTLQVNLLLQAGQSYGVERQLEQRQRLTDGGIPLGFEVVSFDYNDFGHSWICSGLYEDMQQLFGIRPGQLGLIQTREEAQRVNDWIAEDEQQGHRAEPEPYDYWLLVSYPLTT
jgi:hypothetical protein